MTFKRKNITVPESILELAKSISKHYGSSISGLIRILILQEARRLDLAFDQPEPKDLHINNED